MRTANSRKIKLSAAAAVLMGLAFTAQADVITWDGGGVNNLVQTTGNWNPDGTPTGANSGVVGGATKTGYTTGTAQVLIDYEITYSDTASLGVSNGTTRLTLTGGTALTFNNSSALQVGEILMIGGQTAGGAVLTLTGNATASVVSGLQFGNTATLSAPGSLTLQGNSSLTAAGSLDWRQVNGGPSVTHYLTLADSAALTASGTAARNYNGATLIVNFQQASSNATPVWTLGEAVDFSQAGIQYQINGVNTTLADSRFVKQGNSLSLTVIPEPATIGMLGLGALVTLLIRRMGTR